jgi:hypothetical protein
MCAIQVIQTQNVSSISSQFQIKAIAVMKMENKEICAASGILLGQIQGDVKVGFLDPQYIFGAQRLLITFYPKVKSR